MAWRLAEHTADVAVEAEASTQEVALEQAARGLVAVITGRDDAAMIRPTAEVQWEVEAPDDEALLVAWLAEVLWQVEAHDLLWLGGGIDIEPTVDGRRLSARGNAVHYDPSRHGQGTEVKAVTYHDIGTGRGAGGRWRVRVVLDI